MSKHFSENEKRICSYFLKGMEFVFKSEKYKILENADKPTSPYGEPKTDIYISAENSKSMPVEFKISYKQDNADFIENKMNAERAESLLGNDWSMIVERCTLAKKAAFENRILIYKNKLNRTEEGSITLGWKYELLRVKSGELSDKLDLSYEQKYDVYAGTTLPNNKKNAIVNGREIKNSGVADFMFEEITHANNAQDVMNQVLTIDEYLDKYPNIYYACKALNYRSYIPKWDGNRPLSVSVDWFVRDGKLDYNIVYDKPLVIKGNVAANRLEKALKMLGAHDTRELSETNVVEREIIFENK